jgi:hypothetical protein
MIINSPDHVMGQIIETMVIGENRIGQEIMQSLGLKEDVGQRGIIRIKFLQHRCPCVPRR